MEKPVPDVLYETRHHTTRRFCSNYPPQLNDEGAKGGLFSLLSVPGVNQLKEKWNEYKRPRKPKKWISLFVSATGEHVAVAAGNRIIILHKSDDYNEPCGTFTGYDRNATFTLGTWSDSHDVLGAIDDSDTLYFIKTNGEMITRITKRELKASAPIIGLIVQGETETPTSCLCCFSMLTSDGLLHPIEVSQKPPSRIPSMPTSSNRTSVNKRFPQNVLCLDYHSDLSLLVTVDSAFSISGSYCLSLWRRTRNSDVEPLFCSPQLKGIFSIPKSYTGPLTAPKVVISPKGKCIAALHSTGCLDVFSVDDNHCSLSIIGINASGSTEMGGLSNGKRKCLRNIEDFTWWSDRVLTVAKMTGVVTMLDVFTGKQLLEDDKLFSMPVLERVGKCQGSIFLIENTRSEDGHSHLSPVQSEITDPQDKFHVTPNSFHQLDAHKLSWSLLSFSEKSITDMYTLLIGNQQYQAALDFANRHGLDKEEVFKSQWLHSAQGTDDVNMLLNIKDQAFVLLECVHKVGPTEEAVKTLIAHGLRITDKYRFSTSSEDGDSSQIWDFLLNRLQLLQIKDRLETFVGINMGRFSVQEFSKFRSISLNEAAVSLAESGKIGVLNLLFKRHPYSLSPFMLDILAAIPETVPVQTYGQLLPGRSLPTIIALRENDWVECEKMVSYVNRLPENHTSFIDVRTESIVKQSLGFLWPSVDELSLWYKNRARDIDNFSGQLDNSLCLLEFALRKGISELQPFNKSISYLHQLIYSDETAEETNITMSLSEWEQLSDYEKFKMMLDRIKEDSIVEALRARAIPFMLSSAPVFSSSSEGEVMDQQCSVHYKFTDSFLVRWLKEIASDNKLDICSVVIEEGCRDFNVNGIFRDGAEAVECALQCLYLCTCTDRWNTMASILSKLPQIKDIEADVHSRVKVAEGRVEAGRLLAYYQVPKSMSFFQEAHSDPKGVKQILRLILSKFGRRQPGRSDNDWASMWHDMQLFQEKVFPFLDLEYMLMEFCRGLLKAGKFSLARNYLKGTAIVALSKEKAENLVIQAAREYLYSASSLACAEIWKAKECLNLFPNSINVKAEADIMDALTVKLPKLGVTLLPMQFRQILNRMEIINMVITTQIGAYLDVDELIEIAKLLGLSSADDIVAVQEAVAREAAVAGDLQLAFDLCLVLAKKGHGAIWDLCAAIARGPALENMDISSRKQLLGFALSHCDEESIGEMLHAWKDLDLQSQSEKLIVLTGTHPPNVSVQGSSIISLPGHGIQDLVNLTDCSDMVGRVGSNDQELHFENIKKTLSTVAKDLSENGTSWDSLLIENGKTLSFAALQFPWLLELSRKVDYGKQMILGMESGARKQSVRTQAVVAILSWLARNDVTPSDDLIVYLAKSVMESPITEEEDIAGCTFLLNLVDAFHGVEIIEEQLKVREGYHEVCSIMNMGMTYSSLHNSGSECLSPTQRRELLLQKFQQRPTAGSLDKMDKLQSTFWREWKSKLEEQKLLTDQSRALKQIIPGVDTARFLSGDLNYIENAVFSLIDSVKHEKRPSLKEVLKLVDTYSLNHTEVLLRYLASVLVSEVWTNEDITIEISGYKEELMACVTKIISTISSVIYPTIDGCNKQRLAYLYSILSDCYSQLEKHEEPMLLSHSDAAHTLNMKASEFYRVLNQGCERVSFIRNLNFKNLAGLDELKTGTFSDEVYNHIDEFSVEAIAKMVKTLTSVYADPVAKGLVSWQAVYKHYIVNLLTSFKSECKGDSDFLGPETFQEFNAELEQNYVCIRIYLSYLAQHDVLDIMKQYYTLSLPSGNLPDDPAWLDCLIMLLKFWIRLTNDVLEIISGVDSEEELTKLNLEALSTCLNVFKNLVEEEKISTRQGWDTVSNYVKHGLDVFITEVFNFCKALILSGCRIDTVIQVFSGEVVQNLNSVSLPVCNKGNLDNFCQLYVNILDALLLDLANESDDCQELYNLLSSLSNLDGDVDNLKRVRDAIWGRLSLFSHNMQLKSHVRVHILELMQSITGRNLKSLPSVLVSNIKSWEGWDESQCTTGVEAADGHEQNPSDASSKFTNTLVSLKSTRLAATISSSIEITPDDLTSVDSAVSSFLSLCEDANAEPHFKALIAILEEWEGVFTIRKEEEELREEASDAGNNWSSEDWDEGWESFQEEQPVNKEVKEEIAVNVHSLHKCWMQIIKKLISLCKYRDILKLMDRSAKSNVILLDQDETSNLIQLVIGLDCFTALKIALLLPYEAIHLQCLDAVEDKLKQGGLSGQMSEDNELFTLLLSSGAITTIATNPAYGTTFSYFCYMAGHFSRLCQESQLSQVKHRSGEGNTTTEDNTFFTLFRTVLFPCLISELVKVNQTLLAGFLVSWFMHTNTSFSLLNVAEALLRKHVEGQMQLQNGLDPDVNNVDTCMCLRNTVSSLGDRLSSKIHTALSSFADNVK